MLHISNTRQRPRPTPASEVISRAEILGLLAERGPLSRGEIAKQLGLGAATVTAQVRNLMAEGMVRDLPAGQSAGAGRPKVPVQLVPDAAVVIGLGITPRSVVVVSMLLDGEILASDVVPFNPDKEPVGQLAAVVTRQMQDMAHPGRTVAVGISVSGAVDENSSTVIISATLNWENFDLGQQLQQALDLPVFVSNDLFALATREISFGLGRRHDDFLLLGLGPGVGMGIVNRRSVFYGPGGASTEFGHMSVDPEGPRCVCGNRGCLQVYAGLKELLAAAPDPTPETTLDDLSARASVPGSPASSYLDRTGRMLGRSLGGTVNLLGISTIIVTGETTALWEHLRNGFEQGLQETVLRFHHPLTITVREWTEAEGAIGAAGMALHNAVVLNRSDPAS
ncbi:ROK family transcriptional regulator [Paenarthrobacter histidinolovorans]|uniref:ROK family transcriptional regulator n=1 Tax=Paenarthrobacter histidinolovorans TaxID=43664 RepID=UPI001669C6F4|nr:ROK family transcriptional regulator [Paenarthrobacter histidinolovorans]GGJ28453.1 xylose repressor [Paenarthrobacter histidinolovorans]